MPHRITYYATVDGDRTVDNPYGLMRRLEHDDGSSDEALRKGVSWAFTSAIVEWEHGGDYVYDLVEVTHEQASKIIEYFQSRLGAYGQPLDS
jgi:hypothetical protein